MPRLGGRRWGFWMAEMRDEILKTAQAQMSLGGYGNLNFASIAEALGTTRANVHHHFKNKEGLALEVTRQYTMGVLEMAKGMAEDNPGDFKGLIGALEKHIVDSIRESGKESACICGQLIKEHDIPESLREMASGFLKQSDAMLEAAISAAQDAGNLPKEIDPNKMALLAAQNCALGSCKSFSNPLRSAGRKQKGGERGGGEGRR